MNTTMPEATTTPNRRYAYKGFHYCYVLNKHRFWVNQGMVPDDNRAPFIAEYKAKYGTAEHIARVAFVPFCWTDTPNIMTHHDIANFAPFTE